ncbi:uncharacterized protein LOC127002145 [Eriocheir sinensis]|uniref:uncharacterized protein LOC127002145 n=1 Tax=Eriocheir sinensis TaxID=95602 RepID=UPI0021C6E56B|nr:uncharacterized protein LOC127002145 [Eriocheir sinensis]
MAGSSARRASRGLRGCAGRRTRTVKALITVSVLGVFLYHTRLNLQQYLEGNTVFVASEETYPPPMFPPFRFCVWPTWNPLRLLSLGLNISNLTFTEIQENFFKLTGFDEHMTGRQLVESAAWSVEDLMEEVRVGNIHEVYDPSSPGTSQLWRRSFTPLGPCLTFIPPPYASLHAQNLSLKFREKVAGLEPCSWTEKGRVRQYRSSEDCPAARHYCNTSCEWQDFMVDFYTLLFIHLLSTSDDYWMNELKTALLLSKPQSIVVEPFKVLHLKEDGPIDFEACYHECVMADGVKEAGCNALTNASLDKPVFSLCVTSTHQWLLSKDFVTMTPKSDICLNNCKSNRKFLRWKSTPDNVTDPVKNIMRVRLSKSSTLILSETEMYPVSQFLTDTGGGLGLFLGVCALDMWNFLVRVVVSREVVARRPAARTLGHLGQLVGALVVSMGTCVHLLIMGKSYLQQPVTLSASLGASDASHATPSVTLESLLVERMASRVLGCRASSTPKQDECVKCVLQGETGQSLPFISVDDLPRCTAEHLTFPRLAFTVPKLHVEGIARKETTASCSACDHLNDSRPPDFVQYSVDENSPYSPNSMLCTLGGLMGLYLGLSLVNVQDLFQRTLRKRHRDAGGRCRGVARVGFTGGVVAVAVAICFLQLGTFFGAHPVYSSTSTHSLQEGVLPSITTCVWPPFNIRRLLETAGLGAAFANLSLITDPEARDAATALLLQDLPETSNVTDPHILWDASAWSDEELYVSVEVIRVYRSLPSPRHLIKSTIFNLCRRFTPDALSFSSLVKIGYIIYLSPLEHFQEYNILLSYLHYPGEVPLVEPVVLTDTSARVDISAVTKWRTFNANGVGDRGACVYRCLEAAVATHLGCRLSSVDHHDFDSCNMTVFAEFLKTLWRLRTRPQSIYQNLIGQNQTSSCHAACRHGSQSFFRFKYGLANEESVLPGLSVGLIIPYSRGTINYEFTTSVFERMSTHDGYTSTALVSDLGGVVGMTLGVSILSLLLILVTKMSQSRQTLTRVSGALPH